MVQSYWFWTGDPATMPANAADPAYDSIRADFLAPDKKTMVILIAYNKDHKSQFEDLMDKVKDIINGPDALTDGSTYGLTGIGVMLHDGDDDLQKDLVRVDGISIPFAFVIMGL